MAMAAPAARKVAGSAASKAKNVTPKKTSAPKVSRSGNALASHIAKGQATTAEQVNRSNIRVGANKKIRKQNVKAAGRVQKQRVAASTQIAANQQQIRNEAAAANRGRQRNSRIAGAALSTATRPIRTPRSYSAPTGPNPLMLILFTMGGVILIYAMITQPAPTNRFFTGLREWIKLIYTTEPMFNVKVNEDFFK